ncbi:hypothetical protein ACQPZF_29460 [Actinosynnema sp. CS-041913]|uniref:hypothetical protein n=1 Tax=Actinosynnema sp. CS-041913 TaxID=3239917 RepID=UPI003D90E7AB
MVKGVVVVILGLVFVGFGVAGVVAELGRSSARAEVVSVAQDGSWLVPTVRFTAEGGQVVTTTLRRSKKVYRPGDHLPMRYDPEQPVRAQLESRWAWALMFLAVGTGAVVYGIVLVRETGAAQSS